MRSVNTNGPLSVQAVAGPYVVLLGINMKETEKNGVLGFGIQRRDLDSNEGPAWLLGFKSFRQASVPPGKRVPTNQHPIQGFLWGDYAALKDHRYSYRIVAMRGQPGNLHESDEVSISVQMEREKKEGHEVYFNRGVAGSQAYVRRFGDKKPDEIGSKAFDCQRR